MFSSSRVVTGTRYSCLRYSTQRFDVQSPALRSHVVGTNLRVYDVFARSRPNFLRGDLRHGWASVTPCAATLDVDFPSRVEFLRQRECLLHL